MTKVWMAMRFGDRDESALLLGIFKDEGCAKDRIEEWRDNTESWRRGDTGVFPVTLGESIEEYL